MVLVFKMAVRLATEVGKKSQWPVCESMETANQYRSIERDDVSGALCAAEASTILRYSLHNRDDATDDDDTHMQEL